MTSASANIPRSHRPLPLLTDEERSQLSPDAIGNVTALWLRKAQSELGASTSFAEVHRCLVLLGAPSELLFSSAKAVEDELRHAEICHWVAEQYAGQPLPQPRCAAVATNAAFRGCTEVESALLFVALHCALNESVACAYLKRCYSEAETQIVSAVTRDLLSDEVKHARLFFQLIPSRSPSEKALLGEALPALLSSVEDAWLRDTELDSACPKGHGTLSAGALLEVTQEAIRSLVIPGFREAGIDTQKAEDWRPGKADYM